MNFNDVLVAMLKDEYPTFAAEVVEYSISGNTITLGLRPLMFPGGTWNFDMDYESFISELRINHQQGFLAQGQAQIDAIKITLNDREINENISVTKILRLNIEPHIASKLLT